MILNTALCAYAITVRCIGDVFIKSFDRLPVNAGERIESVLQSSGDCFIGSVGVAVSSHKYTSNEIVVSRDQM